MKKLMIMLICIIFIFGGCSKNIDTAVPNDEKISSSSEDEKPQENEFYKMATCSNRPIAIMIDNDDYTARPQIGLENAYIIYEIIVEGGASRMMALFKDYSVEKVGPIRSSRHYFLDYALENNAIYAHAGWSPQAQSDISRLGVQNINGLYEDKDKMFWRDNTYNRTYHNLYTSVKKLASYAENSKNYSTEDTGGVLSFLKEDAEPQGEDCTSINLTYSGFYRVGYTYNAEKALYERSVDGKNHVSQTGDVFTAKNIIIYSVANYDLNDGQNKGRQNINNIGNGEGWYVSLGKAEKITWSKDSRTGKTSYKKADGSNLEVNPGITYIQIMPKGNTINFE